jgi:colanic acid/amylovoran biosynthesis glycosyltransferase
VYFAPSVRRPLLRALRYGVQAPRLMRAHAATRDLDPFDVIHCHFGQAGLLGVRLRALGGIAGRVVTTFHGFDITAFLRARGEHVYDELFERGDFFLPISDLWQRRLIDLGCAPERIAVHRMGIDPERFVFRPRETSEPLEVVSVARLTPKKGLEHGVSAVAALGEAGLPVRYRIAGDGPLRAELEALGGAELLGPLPQEETLRLLDSAHLLLAPSVIGPDGDMEGIPVAIMEAMAMGLPVITTRHSGIPELVEHEVSGYLAPEGNAGALADGIRTVLDDPAVALRWAEAARAKVLANHDIGRLNDQLVERFRALTSG